MSGMLTPALALSAVLMTGALLQLGQFFAARAEFVPEPICRKLALLHDQVCAVA